MKSRLPLLDESAFSPEQRAVYESILSTRGNIDGPFLAWLDSPVFAAHAEKLGAFCRYGTRLSTLEVELLILCVAAALSCDGEQQIHEPIARRAGLDDATIEALRQRQPVSFDDARLRSIHALCGQLLESHRIDDETYQAALALFGRETLVEIVGTIGYYALVAMTLNAFEMTTG